MAYEIPIKVTTGGAAPAIKQVGDALAGVEGQAKKAGDASTEAAKKAKESHAAAKPSVDALAKSFGGLQSELQKEAALLDRLRGPQKRWEEDLRIADRLLDRGAISVAEYTAELKRMNSTLERSATLSSAVKPPDIKKQLGGGAKLLGGLTSGAGGMLGGVEAGLAAGGVLGIAIAAAPAIQKVGEYAVKAADYGLTKLSNALNSSTIEARKAAEAFLKHAAAVDAAFADRAKLESAGEALKAAFAAGVTGLKPLNDELVDLDIRTRAIGRKWGVDLPFSQAAKDALTFADALEQLKQKSALDQLARDAQRTFTSMQQLAGVNDILKAQSDRWQDVINRVETLNDAIEKIKANQTILRGMAALTFKDPNSIQALKIDRDHVAIVRERRDKQLELDTATSRFGKTIADVRIKTLQHKDALFDLKGAFKEGAITMKEYSDGLKALGIEESKATKLLKELQGPAVKYAETFGALNVLYRDGKIGAAVYNEQLLKLLATQRDLASLETPRGKVGARKMGGLDVVLGEEAASNRTFDQSVVAGMAPPAAVGDAMGVQLKTTIDHFEKTNDLTRKWYEELDRIRALTATGFIERTAVGFRDGASAIKEMLDPAQQAAATLTNAFQGVEDTFVSLVTTGKASFKDLVNSMLADLSRLLFKQAMSGLIGALTGGGGLGGGAGALFGGNHAFGGEYRVGGSGGPDSQRVMFNLTPGEHVRFTPPGRASDVARQQPQPTTPTVINLTVNRDTDEAQLEGVVLRVVQRNPGLIRGIVTGR